MKGFGPAFKIAIVLTLLLVAAPVLHAQTTDISLTRLAEAVNAINRDQLQAAEDLLKVVLTASPNDAVAETLAKAGIKVVQDRCIMVDHRYLQK